MENHAKLPATKEYVANLLEQGESVVVFAWERAMAARIASVSKSQDTYVVTGAQHQDDRAKAVEAFQCTGGLLCATIGALREGVTLHRARIVVLHDLDWVLTRLIQAERRIYRIGQTRACQSVWMLAEHSFDRILVPLLVAKARMSQELLGVDHLSIIRELNLTEISDQRTVEDTVDAILQTWEAM